MLDLLALTILIGFVNTPDLNERTSYSSGVKECDNYYINDLPSSTYPLLKLQNTLYNGEQEINPGIYEVILSKEHDYIFLLQSKKVIAKLSVTEKIELNQKKSIETVDVEFSKSSKKAVVIYNVKEFQLRSVLY